MLVRPEFAWAGVVTLAAAVVALVVSFQLAFFLLWFALLGWWVWGAPQSAIYFFIIMAPLLPMFKMTQTIGTLTLLKDVIILALFVKLWLWPLLTKRLPYRRNILLAPLVALIAWTAFAALRSDSLLLGILRARDIVLYVMLYFVTLYLPHTKQLYRQALGWFLISAAIVSALGWYQFFGIPDSAVLRFDPAHEIWIPRVSSVMAHPSIFGQYLILTSTLLIALLVPPVAGLARRSAWWPAVVMGWAALLPLVYLTYSRAVWLGYVTALAAMSVTAVWIRVRQPLVSWRVWSSGILGVVVVAVLILQFTSVGVFLGSAIDPTYASNAERLEFLARLIAPLTNIQALIGTGLGDVLQQNFREIDIGAFDIASGAGRSVQLAKDATLVDNQYLKTFIEMGLAGLLVYSWLYWRLFRASWNLITHYSLLITRVLGLWSIGFLTSFVIQAFFIDIWDIFPTNAAFWIIAALVSREQIPYTTEHDET
jgi:hypothetical protein